MQIKIQSKTHGEKTVFYSNQDHEIISKHKWSVHKRGHMFYALTRIGGKKIQMHRYILDVPEWLIIDHADHNGLNNCRDNLRPCSYSQNQMNKRKSCRGTSSKYKGVVWDVQKQKWRVRIHINKRMICGGVFLNEQQAAERYNQMAKIYFRQFATLNEV